MGDERERREEGFRGDGVCGGLEHIVETVHDVVLLASHVRRLGQTEDLGDAVGELGVGEGAGGAAGGVLVGYVKDLPSNPGLQLHSGITLPFVRRQTPKQLHAAA